MCAAELLCLPFADRLIVSVCARLAGLCVRLGVAAMWTQPSLQFTWEILLCCVAMCVRACVEVAAQSSVPL